MTAATTVYIPLYLDYKVMRLSTGPNKKNHCQSEHRARRASYRLYALIGGTLTLYTISSHLCLTITSRQWRGSIEYHGT